MIDCRRGTTLGFYSTEPVSSVCMRHSEWFSLVRTLLAALPYQQLKRSVRCPLRPCSLRGSATRGGAKSSCMLRVLGRIEKNGHERRYGNHMTKQRGFLTARDASHVCFRSSSQTLFWATVCCLSRPLSLTLSDHDVRRWNHWPVILL
jgi:hypothetical protein